jgi:hypothetical protein
MSLCQKPDRQGGRVTILDLDLRKLPSLTAGASDAY